MPGARALKEGDIVNVDVTFIVDGWYGDSSRMYAIGPIARKAERLIEVTYEAMMRGIAAVKPGATTGDIGHAIQSFVEPQGMSVVRDFCGHGLGNRPQYVGARVKEHVLSRHAVHNRADEVNLGRRTWCCRTAGPQSADRRCRLIQALGRRHRTGVEVFTCLPRRPRQAALAQALQPFRDGALIKWIRPICLNSGFAPIALSERRVTRLLRRPE
jgi:hypothetical protein